MLPESAANALAEAHERLYDGEDPHDVVRWLAERVHLLTLGAIPYRILTAAEIAELFGVTTAWIKELIAREPVIEPVKTVHRVNLYTVEQVPEIFFRHIDNVDTPRWVMKRVRDAAKRAANKQRANIIQENPEVKFLNWSGRTETVTIQLDEELFKRMVVWAERDGWGTFATLVRGLLVAYDEQKGKQ